MTQQVNLYQAGFRREAPQLSAAVVGKALGAAAALLAILYGHSLWRFWRQEWEAARLETSRADYSTRLQALQEQSALKRQDEALSREVETLSEQVRVKERLLAVLAREMPGSAAGFSPYLVALARQPAAGVWLREIRMDEGGRRLLLVGSSLTPEAVPDWLDQLGSEPAFAGREFQRLWLGQSPGERASIDFELDTHVEPPS